MLSLQMTMLFILPNPITKLIQGEDGSINNKPENLQHNLEARPEFRNHKDDSDDSSTNQETTKHQDDPNDPDSINQI